MRRLVIILLALALPLGALHLGRTPEAGAADDAEEKLADDASEILKTLWKLRKRGCGLEAKPRAARKYTRKAAGYSFEYVLPLAETPYETGDRAGVVAFDLDDDTGYVDEVTVMLLTDRYDRKELAEKLIAAAESVGVTLEPDEDRNRCWSGARVDVDPKCVLCFSLGDGVVFLEATILTF